MSDDPRDGSLDTLLDLDGQTFFLNENHWVKFVVKRVDRTPDRPHGLSYSLTLHGASGDRIAGFDNAHPVSGVGGPSRKAKQAFDHKNRLRTIRPYGYSDAASLLADFWAEVDSVLREKGVIP
jgi:hypothetical protein